MDIRPLSIPGAYEITPRVFGDERGVFLESFRHDHLAEATGRPFQVQQTNVSVSCRGAVRGVHFADLPPGQAKYVTVLSGAILDIVVDIRVGSPTFGQSDTVLLDTVDRRAILLAEGLGHVLCALEDGSTAMYLCSHVYTPGREHGITPLDPDLQLPLPEGLVPLLSPKDAAAPTLSEALHAGLLPTWEAAQAYLVPQP